jgi:putative phage-type endonuclease
VLFTKYYEKEKNKVAFRIITHLEQGTSRWREWRKSVIGASDAPKIMGEGFRSSENTDDLLREKLGIKKEWSGNAKSHEGTRLEPHARKFLIKEHGHKLVPIIIQDLEKPFIVASLDAIDKSYKYIFEIKCGEYSYKKSKETGNVPVYYKGQLQHMLMVSELDYLYYCAYRPGEIPVQFKIERDEGYIKKLRKKELEFADKLIEKGHILESKFYGKVV